MWISVLLVSLLLGQQKQPANPVSKANPKDALAADLQTLQSALDTRQLTELNDHLSQATLAQTTTPINIKSQAVIRVSQAMNQKASLLESADKRELAWRQVDDFVSKWSKDLNREGYTLWFRFHLSQLALRRAQLMNELYQATRSSNERMQAADAARKGLARLAELDRDVVNFLQFRQRERDDVAQEQLDTMALGVDYRRGLLQLQLGLAEEREVPRDDAFNQTEQLLKNYVREFAVTPVQLESRLAIAEAYLEQNRLNDLSGMLQSFITTAEVPSDARERAHLLLARASLRAKEPSEAISRLDLAELPKRPDWRFWLIASHLEKAESFVAKNNGLASESVRLAVEQIELLEKTAGAYWKKRAEQLLADHFNLVEISGNPKALMRVVRALPASHPNRMAILDRCFEAAVAEHAVEIAFQVAETKSQLQASQKQLPEAAATLQLAATRFPNAPESAKLWLKSSALLLNHINLRPKSEHPELWVKHEEAIKRAIDSAKNDEALVNDGRLLLAQAAEKQSQPMAAYLKYAEITSSSKHGLVATQAQAELAYDQFNEMKRPLDEDSRHLLKRFIQDLETRLKQLPTNDPSSSAIGLTQFVLAEFFADPSVARFQEATAMLDQAVAGNRLPKQLAGRVRFLRTNIMLASSTPEQISTFIKQSFPNDIPGAKSLLSKLELTTEIPTEPAQVTQRQTKAKAAAQLAELILAGDANLEARERNFLQLTMARAELIQNKPDQARRRLSILLEENPNNLAALRTLADAEFDEQRFAAAEPMLARIARGIARGSAEWFRVMYRYVYCLAKQNKHAAAKKAIAQVKQRFPNLGGPESKKKFDELESTLK